MQYVKSKPLSDCDQERDKDRNQQQYRDQKQKRNDIRIDSKINHEDGSCRKDEGTYSIFTRAKARAES
ncbi:hypothetical protein EVAR_94207_1 [Eumeta japonica]|uniref:Uncharacterized protein n=1 Tax=Eumeta variegata TaxID=151549 RepID=A0A4C1UMZ1_EUMVA|nr:hypothetical protein EVAR_94207_1 [Eumeta japonica]